MEKPQLGAGKAADCDASSPFSSTTSTAGLDSRHALSVGNRSYQSSSPSSPFMRSNHHMSMAMGTLDHAPHSSVDNSSHSADSCWSSVPAWEHQQSSAGNMEAGAAGDYASSGWDINWESFVPVSARGDGGRRMAASDFDLGGGGVPKSSGFNLGAASMASVAGGTSQKSFPAAFASSAPSGITSSSGIPGLAPTGGGAHGTFSTPSDHTFTPDSSVRNAGMDFRVKAEVDTPLGLEQQQEHPRKTGSLQDLRAYGQKTSPNAGVISDHKVDGMSSMDSPQQQQQPQSQQQPEQQQQRASSQASMLGMGNGIEQQRRLFLGLGGVVREVDDSLNNSSGSSKGPAGEDVKDGAHSNAVDGATVVGDLGLKLGRRTYFEDGPGGVSPATGARQSASSPSFAGSPPGKKQRSQPPVVQIPRCQVEGCKADLSNAKEYHRRHKVCEVHSKAAKVIVNKQEQRFCQQCSRFHELSEFDEGKRSCRRRLAGHNERRRKPQPDSGSAITCVNPSLQSASFYGDDDKRNGLGGYLHQRGGPTPTCIDDSDDGNSLKLNHGKSPWPSMSRMDEQSSLACQIQVTGAERSPYLSRVPLAHPATTSDRLLMLLQSSPKGQIAPMSSGMAGSGVHHFLQGSGPIGQGLTLSSSSGAGVLAGLEATPASQGLSGISDSGRALSLLSSQPWGSRAPGSGSLDLSPRSTLTLDQLLAENRAPLAQQLMSGSSAGGQQHFSPLVEKLSMQPHSPGNIGVSLSVNGTSSGERDHHHTSAFMSGYPDFGNNSMLALLQGQEIRALQTGNGQHVRPTIDLMQLPSPQSQSNHHASRLGPMQSQGGQYSDFALRSFESSMFDTQQML